MATQINLVCRPIKTSIRLSIKLLTKKWPYAMTASRLVPNDNASVPQRRGNPPPEERVYFLTCIPSRSSRARRVRIFLAPSRRKHLPADYEDVASSDRKIAGPIIMERARQVSLAYGADVAGSERPAFRREARNGRFRLMTESYVDHGGRAVLAVTIIDDRSVCFDGSLTQKEGCSVPEVKIRECKLYRWRKRFFGAFPIYEPEA